MNIGAAGGGQFAIANETSPGRADFVSVALHCLIRAGAPPRRIGKCVLHMGLLISIELLIYRLTQLSAFCLSSITGLHPLSGLNRSIFLTAAAVFGPRSF